ncbi:inhibitor of apoptosis repeat-containing protein [Neocallimastix sp. 'constans']
MDEMHIFQHRLNSFGKRGCNWPHKHFKATALRLAQVGFYYDSKGLYNDKVSCYLCKCSYHGWKKDDIPMEIHKKTSPQCPLVEILDYSKEWVRNPTEDQTYEPISSHLLKSRIETYSNWWPHTYPNITPERMAEAGFYYSPDIELEDKVECAYCKAKFGNWTHNDNPRSKHFRFNEKCPFFCVAKLKRRRLKKKDNESKKNKKNRKDDELTDNSSNKSIEKNNKKKKGKIFILIDYFFFFFFFILHSYFKNKIIDIY